MIDIKQISDGKFPMYMPLFLCVVGGYAGLILGTSLNPDRGVAVVMCCIFTVFLGMDLGGFFARKASWVPDGIAWAKKTGIFLGYLLGIFLGLVLYNLLAPEGSGAHEVLSGVHESGHGDPYAIHGLRGSATVGGSIAIAILGVMWALQAGAFKARKGIVGGLIGIVLFACLIVAGLMIGGFVGYGLFSLLLI